MTDECPMCGALRSHWRQPVIAQGSAEIEVHTVVTPVQHFTLPAYTLTRGSNAVMPPIIVEADPISEATE